MVNPPFQLLSSGKQNFFLISKNYGNNNQTSKIFNSHVSLAFDDYDFIKKRFIEISPLSIEEEYVNKSEFTARRLNRYVPSNTLDIHEFNFTRSEGRPIEAYCSLFRFSSSKNTNNLFGAALYLKLAAEDNVEDFIFPILKRLAYVDQLILPGGIGTESGWRISPTLEETTNRFFQF